MSKQKRSKIGSLKHADHEYLRDNDFIHGGYRLNFNSFGKLLKSLFMFHNESFNVWSHLLGVCIFLAFLGYTIAWLGMPSKVLQLHIMDDLKLSIINTMNDLAYSAAKYENLIESRLVEIYQDAYSLTHELDDKVHSIYNKLSSENTTESMKPLLKKLEIMISEIDSQRYDWIDAYSDKHLSIQQVHRWPLFVYIVSAMICLMCSSIFHLFSAHSLMMNKMLSRLDYAGISILIAGSFYPMIYYAFYCFPRKIQVDYILVYLVGMSVAATITFVISFIPSFQSPSMRWFRGVLFVCLALLGIIPICHLYFL
jgi:adiponectin receptor